MTNDASRHDGPDPLAALRGGFPRWQAWRGISGLFYARRLRTSPPVIIRAVTADELAAKITEHERGNH
jgi:hypothetical protein